MSSSFLPSFSACMFRAIVITAVCLSVAHAQQGEQLQPGLLQSRGKLPAPSPAASAPAAGDRTLAVTSPGQGRRIALVIGNGDYQYSDNLPKLANPSHDAEDIAKALRGFGFEVIERKNQTLEAMNQAIAEFGSKIGGSEAALFYFAGHGLQVKNQNYLMPVNAKIESEAVVPYQGVNVNQILDEMDNGKSSANIVILDACRNNPISGKFRSGKSRGLASPGSTPKGTVIVFATDPGNVAADGDGRNGLFTAGLLTAFKGKDLSLDDVLTVASAEVEHASGQTQSPYVNGPRTLQKSFYFRVTVDPGRGEIEKTFWSSIEHSTDPADFEAYLRKYPKGSYRALAENQIKRLKASQKAASASALAKPVAVQPAPVIVEDPETQFWNEVKASGAREYLDAYLKQYPKGKYLALAKIELKKLDDQDRAQRARAEAEKQQTAERERQEAMRRKQEEAESNKLKETTRPQIAQKGPVNSVDEKNIIDAIRHGNYSPANDIQVKAPDIGENGSVIPVEINANRTFSAGERLFLVVNDRYVAASVTPYNPRAMVFLSTRVKMVQTGALRAVLVDKTGRIYVASKEVKVIIGSNDPNQPQNGALGEVKMRTVNSNGRLSVKALLDSPQAPNLYAKSLSYLVDGEKLVEVGLTPVSSKNPFVEVWFSGSGSEVKAQVEASDGTRAVASADAR
jgi:predicted secreted protein